MDILDQLWPDQNGDYVRDYPDEYVQNVRGLVGNHQGCDPQILYREACLKGQVHKEMGKFRNCSTLL